MKKKIILITAVALLLAVVGYGTYAALNASATAKNVITMGTVKVSLRDEIQSTETVQAAVMEEQPNGIWEAFPESLVDIQPGSVVNKRVYVKNEGNSSCYVRLKLSMTVTPKESEELQMKSTSGLDPADVKFSYENNPNWTLDGDGYYRYNNILAPGDETPDPLYCTIDFDKNKMANEYLGAKFEVMNIAQAVQSKNNTYDTASGGSVLDVQGWPVDTSDTDGSEELIG